MHANLIINPVSILVKLYKVTYSYFFVSGSQAAFQQATYSTEENDGSVEVCIELRGDPLTTPRTVRVMTQDGTARGEWFIYFVQL